MFLLCFIKACTYIMCWLSMIFGMNLYWSALKVLQKIFYLIVNFRAGYWLHQFAEKFRELFKWGAVVLVKMQLAIVVCQMWQKFFPLVENRTSNPSNIPEYTSMHLECPISEPNSALEIHSGLFRGVLFSLNEKQASSCV